MSASAIPSVHAMRTAALAEAFGSNAAAFAELLEEGQKVNYDSCKSRSPSRASGDSGAGGRMLVVRCGELELAEGSEDEGQVMEMRLPRSGVGGSSYASEARSLHGLAHWAWVDDWVHPASKCTSRYACWVSRKTC